VGGRQIDKHGTPWLRQCPAYICGRRNLLITQFYALKNGAYLRLW